MLFNISFLVQGFDPEMISPIQNHWEVQYMIHSGQRKRLNVEEITVTSRYCGMILKGIFAVSNW